MQYHSLEPHMFWWSNSLIFRAKWKIRVCRRETCYIDRKEEVHAKTQVSQHNITWSITKLSSWKSASAAHFLLLKYRECKPLNSLLENHFSWTFQLKSRMTEFGVGILDAEQHPRVQTSNLDSKSVTSRYALVSLIEFTCGLHSERKS